MRVALVPRSAEIQPGFSRFVKFHPFFLFYKSPPPPPPLLNFSHNIRSKRGRASTDSRGNFSGFSSEGAHLRPKILKSFKKIKNFRRGHASNDLRQEITFPASQHHTSFHRSLTEDSVGQVLSIAPGPLEGGHTSYYSRGGAQGRACQINGADMPEPKVSSPSCRRLPYTSSRPHAIRLFLLPSSLECGGAAAPPPFGKNASQLRLSEDGRAEGGEPHGRRARRCVGQS